MTKAKTMLVKDVDIKLEEMNNELEKTKKMTNTGEKKIKAIQELSKGRLEKTKTRPQRRKEKMRKFIKRSRRRRRISIPKMRLRI